jgi:hypothetical protein
MEYPRFFAKIMPGKGNPDFAAISGDLPEKYLFPSLTYDKIVSSSCRLIQFCTTNFRPFDHGFIDSRTAFHLYLTILFRPFHP